MSSTLEFRRPRLLPRGQIGRDKPPDRLLGNKLQEIAMRSPNDLRAIEVLADFVLARLNEQDRVTRA